MKRHIHTFVTMQILLVVFIATFSSNVSADTISFELIGNGAVGEGSVKSHPMDWTDKVSLEKQQIRVAQINKLTIKITGRYKREILLGDRVIHIYECPEISWRCISYDPIDYSDDDDFFFRSDEESFVKLVTIEEIDYISFSRWVSKLCGEHTVYLINTFTGDITIGGWVVFTDCYMPFIP